METEVDLICARGSILFTFPENLAQLTIYPSTAHPWALDGAEDRNDVSSLGIYPTTATNENGRQERGASGNPGPTFFYQKTDVFVPVGSGMHR